MPSGTSHFTVVPFPLNVGSTKCANIVISVTRLPYHWIKHYASGLPVWECTQPQLNQWLWAVNPTVSAAPPQALHQQREPTKNKRWRLLTELKQKDDPQSADDRTRFCLHRRQTSKNRLRSRTVAKTIRLQTSSFLLVGFLPTTSAPSSSMPGLPLTQHRHHPISSVTSILHP